MLAGTLLAGHLTLLVSRTDTSGSPLERWVLAAFAPAGHLAAVTVEGIEQTLDGLSRVPTLERENRHLEDRVLELETEVARLHGIEEELDRLARRVSYERPQSEISIADVVFVDRDSWLRSLVLYTGRTPAERNQPVVTDRGLVGRIILAGGRYAKVQLVTDRQSAISAMVARTRRKGLVRGVDAEELSLEHIPRQADVRIGDEVVTAGLDGIFPRGIPLGRVATLEPEEGLFHRIRLHPALDLGRIDQVYVLDRESIPETMRREWERRR